jgi:hypothetical protein
MNGPWKDEEELMKCMLYWQKEALEGYNFLEMEADYIEDLIKTLLQECREKEYYKQQFLDKQAELEEVMKSAVFIVGGE